MDGSAGGFFFFFQNVSAEVLNDEAQNAENVSERWSGASAGFTGFLAADETRLGSTLPLLAAFKGDVKDGVSFLPATFNPRVSVFEST